MILVPKLAIGASAGAGASVEGEPVEFGRLRYIDRHGLRLTAGVGNTLCRRSCGRRVDIGNDDRHAKRARAARKARTDTRSSARDDGYAAAENFRVPVHVPSVQFFCRPGHAA